MFRIGDLVTRVDFSIEERDMYIDWTYEVASVHRVGTDGETVQLTGMTGHFYTSRFVLARKQNRIDFTLLASDYMGDTKLDEEDKKIIGEAICSM